MVMRAPCCYEAEIASLESALAASQAEVARLNGMLSPLREMAKVVATQDNRATADPVFCVEERGRFGVWSTVNSFFTGAAALEYAKTATCHRGPLRVFVESAHRNHEWKAVRALLLALAAHPVEVPQ